MKRISILLLLSIVHLNSFCQDDGTFYSLNEALERPDEVTFLNLSGSGLKFFPDEIKCFKNLQSLALYDNEISHIPSWIVDMKKLTAIFLGGNLGIDSLTNLAPMIWIEGIDLSDLELEKIPSFIFNFYKLEFLKMTSNRIYRIPYNLNDLQHLTFLNLSFNRIKRLPKYLFLPKLEKLFLSSNPIKSIPSSIGNMTSLNELYLGSTNIETLPNTLLENNSLYYVDITRTKIKSYTFFKLKKDYPNIYWD